MLIAECMRQRGVSELQTKAAVHRSDLQKRAILERLQDISRNLSNYAQIIDATFRNYLEYGKESGKLRPYPAPGWVSLEYPAEEQVRNKYSLSPLINILSKDYF
jgi:hypothetical protein